MALIKCPECGKEISDKSSICVGCGFPISDYLKEQEEEKEQLRIQEENNRIELRKYVCKTCGHQNPIGTDYCDECGFRITPYVNIKQEINEVESTKDISEPITHEEEFNGMYKFSFFGGKKEVYCPRCGSSDCSPYKEQVHIPGKTKTSYSANLNPFKLFTFANKKEKIIRNDTDITLDKFICNKCGKIFS